MRRVIAELGGPVARAPSTAASQLYRQEVGWQKAPHPSALTRMDIVMGRLKQKICVVTGAAGGIGQAIVDLFRDEGACVIATDLDGGALRSAGSGTGWNVALDVTDEAGWTRLMSEVNEREGRLDVLINCAGWEGPTGHNSIESATLDSWRRVQAINVEGTWFGCRSAMPLMQRAGAGSIVNFSSIASFYGTPHQISYGVSKAAVEQLTKSVALNGARHKIRCNSVHPGLVDTLMLSNIYSGIAEETGSTADQISDTYRSAVPLRRCADPRDIAMATLYLASDESSYVTGISLTVDGGLGLT